MNKRDPREFRRAYAQEDLIANVTEDLCRLMEEQKISRAELARRADTTPSHITQLLDGTRNMTLRTTATLAHALSCHASITFSPEVEPTRTARGAATSTRHARG
jgi:transcriptional regulator with XRE-family HTH domain